MVKIIYGEYSQEADLAGKTVAEVRELYKPEFSIPDRAKANLNGKQLKKELEPKAKLGDDDKLAFEEKSRKALVLLGAFLLTLAVTAGLFVYTYTVTSKTITVHLGTADFGNVADSGTSFNYDLLGRAKGTIRTGYLFSLTADADYTGDMEVQVYLSNIDELIKDYSFWMMRLQLVHSDNVTVDIEGITQVLSLENPMVSFAVQSDNLSETCYVRCLGGSYKAFPFAWLTGYNPVLFAQVVQAGP